MNDRANSLTSIIWWLLAMAALVWVVLLASVPAAKSPVLFLIRWIASSPQALYGALA
jgi:hypothetical protein